MSDTSFTSTALNTALAQITDVPLNLVASVYSSASGTSGVWSYKVTPMNGGEGLPSSGISFTHTVNSGVAVSFTTVANATDYHLYRSGAGYTGYMLVGRSGNSPIYDLFNKSGSFLYPSQNTTNKESRGLGTTATTFYTASGVRTLFKEAVLANSHTDVVTFSLYVVPSGETASPGNVLFNQVSLDINESKILSLNTVLGSGDTIQAKCNDIGFIPGWSVVSLKISGIEISDN